MADKSTFGAEPEGIDRLLAMYLEESDSDEDALAKASRGQLLERPGGWIGRYKLLSVLGEGGMGIVYLAEQAQPIKRTVALKVIKPGMDSARIIARFEAERQALALLDHPNIAHVYDAGTTEAGRPYFVMEYVEGLPVTEHCDHHKLTIDERLKLFLEVCHAVSHAHQKGIIHRDIKPSNILVSTLDNQAVPKIIDFGVAKAISQPLTERTLITEQGRLFGTPEYMSPEQANMAEHDIDTRSDIYSLGILLYVLLTGTLPFDTKNLREGGFDNILRVICETDPKTPSTRLMSMGEEAKKFADNRRIEVQTLAKHLRKELEWIPMKAMRKERSERYRSVSELADDIDNYIKGNPLIAGPLSTIYRLKKFVRRNAALSSAIMTAGVILIIGLVTTTSMYVQANRARAETQAWSDFLLDSVIQSMNPYQTGGTKITIRSVLDAASEYLEQGKFKVVPLAEEEIRTGLGTGYWCLGAYDQAASHYERALEICLTHLGPDHPTTLLRMKNLGWNCFYQSRYKEAQQLFEKALQGMQRLEDDERWSTMGTLATVYLYQGRFQDAEKLSREALNAVQRMAAEEYTVAFRLVLGVSYTFEGRYSEAEEQFRKGLEISGRELQVTQWHTLDLRHNFGELCRLMGRYAQAEKLLNEAFIGRRDVWGEENTDTLNTMVRLGWLYHNQGRYEEAESLFLKVLKTSREVLGEEHSQTGLSMHGLGTVYLCQGRHDEAEPLLEEALKIANDLLGEKNWYALHVMNTLAKLYMAQGKSVEAESLFKQTLAGRLSKLGDEHPDTLETIHCLGVLRREQKNYAEAESLLRQALEDRRRKLGENHPACFESMHELAVLYIKQGDYDKAEPLLLEAIKGRRLKLGDTHPHTIESIKTLIGLYEAWNKPEKAEKLRAKLLQTGTIEQQ